MSTQLILGVVGAAIGAPFGMASLGWSIGSAIGGAMVTPEPKTVEGPRITDLKVQTSTYGNTIPQFFGTVRVAGNVIWKTDVIEHRHETTTEQGGKGGGQEVTTVTYTYTISVAISLGKGVIDGIRRIWAGGELIYQNDSVLGVLNAPSFVVYPGDEDQLPDPTIEAYLGVGNVPAYRGQAYVVLPDFDITKYGARIPNLMFEVVAAGSVAVPYMICNSVNPPSGVYWLKDGKFAVGLASHTVALSAPPGYTSTRYTFTKRLMLFDGTFTGPERSRSFVLTYLTGESYIAMILCKNDPDLVFFRMSVSAGGVVCVLFDHGKQSQPFLANSINPYSYPQSAFSAYGYLYVHAQDGLWRVSRGNRPVAVNLGLFTGAFCVGQDGQLYFHVPMVSISRLNADGAAVEVWSCTNFVNSWALIAVDGDMTYYSVASGADTMVAAIPVRNGVVSYSDPSLRTFLFPNGSLAHIQNTVYLGNGLVSIPPYGIANMNEAVSEASVPLSSAVTTICTTLEHLEAGDIDVSALVGNVQGYTIANRMSGRNALQPLLDAYQIEVCESAGKVKFLHRGAAPVATISSQEIIPES